MWFFKNKAEPKPPFFVWSRQDHSVGVPMFDDEHRHLTAMMAQIHQALQGERDYLLARMLTERLVQETRIHFTHEEDAMEAAHFPGLQAHAAEHAALIAQADEALRKGSMSALMFPLFLRDWLIPHMRDCDRKYTAALRHQGRR